MAWEALRGWVVSEDSDARPGRAERRWTSKPIIMKKIIPIASVSTVLQNIGLPRRIFVLREAADSTGGTDLTERDRFCTMAVAAKELVRPEPNGRTER